MDGLQKLSIELCWQHAGLVSACLNLGQAVYCALHVLTACRSVHSLFSKQCFVFLRLRHCLLSCAMHSLLCLGFVCVLEQSVALLMVYSPPQCMLRWLLKEWHKVASKVAGFAQIVVHEERDRVFTPCVSQRAKSVVAPNSHPTLIGTPSGFPSSQVSLAKGNQEPPVAVLHTLPKQVGERTQPSGWSTSRL